MDIVGAVETVFDAKKILKEGQVDLVFLDNHLKDGNGIDLLKSLDRIDFKIIFVTGHEEFAIEAFKFSAIDYLMKPVDPDELIGAVKKVERQIIVERDQNIYQTLIANLTNKDYKKLVLRTHDAISIVETPDIVRCHGDAGYTSFCLGDSRQIMVSKNLKYYEDLLSSYGFFRVHQSHLVNLKMVDSYHRKDEVIIMKNKDVVPLAQRKKEAFIQILSTYS